MYLNGKVQLRVNTMTQNLDYPDRQGPDEM